MLVRGFEGGPIRHDFVKSFRSDAHKISNVRIKKVAKPLNPNPFRVSGAQLKIKLEGGLCLQCYP